MTWDVWPRDANLGRSLDPVRFASLDLVERYNAAGTWVLTGAASDLAVFTPGMGCILDRDGEQIVSGQVRTFERSFEVDDDGRAQDTVTLGFVEDTWHLWTRLCWPTPSHALSTTPSNFPNSHDVRTGARETILLGYIGANLGPAAPLSTRRLPALLLPATVGRGGSTTFKARFNVLGDVVATLAEAGGLRVRVVHDETTGVPRLALRVESVQDVADDIVFGSADVARATGHVTSWKYSLGMPEVTDAIVAAAGEATDRLAARFTDAAAVTMWGQRVEQLVDQRQTDDTAQITDAGTTAIEEGASPVSVEFTVADGGDAIFRDTYDLGFKVGIELPGLPLAVADNTVREVTTTVRAQEPESLSVVVGSPGAMSTARNQAARLNKALRRIAQLERAA